MKRSLLYFTCLLTFCSFLHAQTTDSFDIAAFKSPAGWTKQAKDGGLIFSTSDQQKNAYAMIVLYGSAESSSSAKSDFDTDWKQFVVGAFGVKDKPQMEPEKQVDGWTVTIGGSTFQSDLGTSAVILSTYSGYGKKFSAAAIFNSQDYLPMIDAFASSIVLRKPVANAPAKNSSPNVSAIGFTTTNFDDGWTGVAKEDWVEVTKGQIRVLLHYPKAGTVIAADPEPHVVNAWNILVAPRYSNLKGFKIVSPSLDHQRAYLGAGFLTDNQTGREVFVSLFRKTGAWIEIITPDKNTFIQNFGFDINNVRWDADSDIWIPLSKMDTYNKFGISTADFDGEWTDRFSSNTFYTNIYTGLSAGMSTYSSSESFVFSAHKNYNWHLIAVNSAQGRSTFGQGKSAGIFKVLSPWQINFSNLEGKPKTYNAYFSYIKGGKVLWMKDAAYSDSVGYTGYGKK